jgi:Ca2+-binding RTX toxin-like protein
MPISDPTALSDAIAGLPLVDPNGNPVTLDLLGGSLQNEALLFFIPKGAVDSSHALSVEAQAVIFEANALAQASAAAGHPLDIVVVPFFGGNVAAGADAEAVQLVANALSPSVTLLHLDSTELFDAEGNRTPTGDAAFAFQDVYNNSTGTDFASGGTTVLHAVPAAATLAAITYAQVFSPGIPIADDRIVVLEAPLEAALAATGAPVDLPADTGIPPGQSTTELGAYDAVGEFMPNLTFTDADGQPLSLLEQTDGLLVLSLCTEWCGPCANYSSSLNDVASLAGSDFAFVEMLLENVQTGLARTIDAQEWRDRFGLNEAVVTPDGDRVKYLDFVHGALIEAFPTYFVIDGATGRILDRFAGFAGTDDLVDHLFDVLGTYGSQPGETILGTSKADHLVGTMRSDTIFGDQRNDVIDAGAGNDRIDGGTGLNTLIGGRGNDIYVISDGRLDHNTIIETDGAGIDTIEIARGGKVNIGNSLPANVERLSITAAESVDFVASGDGASIDFGFVVDATTLSRIETIRGTGLNDRIQVNLSVDGAGPPGAGLGQPQITVAGANGADIIDVTTNGIGYLVNGNGGDDTITLITGFGETASVNGGAGNDILVGGNGDEELKGGDGNDDIRGGSGNDTLVGGDGTNTLNGGRGDDTYIVSSESDIITEDSSTLVTLVTSDAELFAIFEFYGIDFEQLIESGGNLAESQNVGQPNPIGEAFLGQSWPQIALFVYGLAIGEIPFEHSPSGEIIVGGDGGGIDLVKSSVTFDLGSAVAIENLTLTGNRDIDGFGNDLANTITGNGGANHLTGAGGDDVIDGKGGDDTMEGGTGSDTYIVNTAKDKVIELADAGSDTVQTLINYTLGANIENLVLIGNANDGTGNALANVLTGNARANTLSGGDGNDLLLGGEGGDTLRGGNGDDTLIGGAGNDSLFGDAGADRFVFGGLDGKDTITGFEVAGDIIELAGEKFSTFAQLMSHAHQVGQNTQFTFDDGDIIILKGVNIGTLSAQNFDELLA